MRILPEKIYFINVARLILLQLCDTIIFISGLVGGCFKVEGGA